MSSATNHDKANDAGPLDNNQVSQKNTKITTKANASDSVSVIYHKTIGPLTAMLKSKLGNGPPDPEDIAQQAYQKLLERSSLSDIKNIEAYLWRTATNLIYDFGRGKSVRSRYDYELEQLFFPPDGADPGPERVFKAREQIKLLQKTLLAMPEKRRRIFLLHRIDGMTITAAGHELGITESAARKHITKAMIDLDECLLEDNDG